MVGGRDTGRGNGNGISRKNPFNFIGNDARLGQCSSILFFCNGSYVRL